MRLTFRGGVYFSGGCNFRNIRYICRPPNISQEPAHRLALIGRVQDLSDNAVCICILYGQHGRHK